MTEKDLELMLKNNPALKVHGAENAQVAQWNNAPRLPAKGIEAIRGEPVKRGAVVAVEPVKGVKVAKQTKCEMEYGRMLAMEFPGAKIKPWGVTLWMENSHKYTPDFLVVTPFFMLLIEVKQRGNNGFRQQSYQRAKVAYDQCRVEFDSFQYRWVEKHNGVWNEHK
jgi:hypothetical protein